MHHLIDLFFFQNMIICDVPFSRYKQVLVVLVAISGALRQLEQCLILVSVCVWCVCDVIIVVTIQLPWQRVSGMDFH